MTSWVIARLGQGALPHSKGGRRAAVRSHLSFVALTLTLGCAGHAESSLPPPSTPVAAGAPTPAASLAPAPVISAPPAVASPPAPPSAAAEDDELPAGAPITRPWLGIEMRPTPQGVLVGDVFPGSAAESAGLRSGDRLVALANAPIVEPPDVHVALNGHRVGEDVELRIERAGQPVRLNLRLGAKPDSTELLRSLFIGTSAPSISSLRTVSGSVVPSYSQLRGKVVVLEFWATWCVACRAMAPTLNRWFDGMTAQGVRVLAVSSEPFEEVSNALPQLGLRYPVFTDESTEVSQAYRAGAIPTLFLVDQQGVIRDVMVGYDPEELAALEARINALLQQHP